MKVINLIYITLILTIIIIFLYIVNNKYYSFEHFNNTNDTNDTNNTSTKYLSYYRCKDKMLGKILQSVFDKNNIIHSDENWNIYIPCGYNNVENELTKIKIDPNNDIKNKYIFGLNGCDTIVSKNKIWESLVNCYGRTHARKLMPESYILGDPNEMMQFRKDFNPVKNDIYILKKNVQRKEGLKLTRDFFEILEASADNYKVAQKYITDLYLINERKVNLRIYLMILIKDDVVYFYLCENGKCIYTNKKYNHDDLDFESNITSYHLDMNIYKTNPRDFNELKKYIDSNNSNNSKDKSTELFDNIELLFKDISKCLSRNFYQSKNIEGSVTFQLFGADVIFNKDLHPYLLECNKGPDMIPRDKIDELMKNNVQTDMFKIVGLIPNDKNNSFNLIYKSNLLNKK